MWEHSRNGDIDKSKFIEPIGKGQEYFLNREQVTGKKLIRNEKKKKISDGTKCFLNSWEELTIVLYKENPVEGPHLGLNGRMVYFEWKRRKLILGY